MPRDPPVMSAAFPASEIMVLLNVMEENLYCVRPLRMRKPLCDGAKILTANRGDTRCCHKITKKRLRECIIAHSLRMPLHPGYPVRIAGPFHRFDHAIRRKSRHAQISSRLANRLMMRAVDLRFESAGDFRHSRIRLKPHGMERLRLTFAPPPCMLARMLARRSQFAWNILDKAAAQMDVQNLHSVTNGQHGLAFAKRMFEERHVRALKVRVRFGGLEMPRVTVERGINVRRAARKYKCVNRLRERPQFLLSQ